MRNLFLIALAIFCLFTLGCDGTSSSPPPKPTFDAKTEYTDELKRLWQALDNRKDPHRQSRDLCEIDHQHSLISRIVDTYKSPKAHGIKASDFGATDEQLNSLLRSHSVELVRAYDDLLLDKLPDLNCDTRFDNPWHIAESIKIILESAGLRPQDAGLTEARIQAKMRHALLLRVDAWREQQSAKIDTTIGYLPRTTSWTALKITVSRPRT